MMSLALNNWAQNFRMFTIQFIFLFRGRFFLKQHLGFDITDATAWKKCQEVPPYIMNGDMCCQDDWCEVICDRGYYSSDYAFFTCMELGSERYGWVDANGEEILPENFPGTTCSGNLLHFFLNPFSILICFCMNVLFV